MRRALPLLVGMVAGCGPKEGYPTGVIDLATAFSAKETCSCVFVMGHDEDFCADWTRVSPDVAKFKVDRDDKTVKSRALLFWSTEARWVDEHDGCVLVGP